MNLDFKTCLINLRSFDLSKLRIVFLLLMTSSTSPLMAQVLGSANLCPTGGGPTTYSAHATTYTLGGTGACGYPSGSFDPNYYAAIAGTSSYGGDYQSGEICGACAAAYYGSNAVTVMIIDNCSTCADSNQLDLGPVAFNALTGNTTGDYAINWNFVPCPLSLMTGDSSGDISYEWKQCGNANYNPIQFLDTLFPITAVGWSTGATGPFTALQDDYNNVGGNSYWSNAGQNLNGTNGPFYFAVTDARGDTVTLGPISGTTCGVAAANAQFNGCGPTATPTITGTPTRTDTPGGPPTPTYTFTPVSSGDCVYDYGSGAACTFTQNASIDNCTTSSSSPSTQAINQFYAYGASGVSVLYCSGDSEGPSGSGAGADPTQSTSNALPRRSHHRGGFCGRRRI